MTPIEPRENIVLIGMPGVGKSTVGVLLAKETGRGFVDTDVFIQSGERDRLPEIIEREGMEGFCGIEQQYVLRLDVRGCVIATGGSVIYSEAGMQRLAESGVVIWLDLPLDRLARRLENLSARGVVIPPGQSLEDLYNLRRPLYRRWADLRIDCSELSQDRVVSHIASLLEEGRE